MRNEFRLAMMLVLSLILFVNGLVKSNALSIGLAILIWVAVFDVVKLVQASRKDKSKKIP